MLVFLIVVITLVCFLLVLVILAQNPKGGLSSQFGGSGTSNIIGVKKTTDILENLTWTFGAALLVLSLSTNFFIDNTSASNQLSSPNIERAQESIPVTPDLQIETDPNAPGIENGADDASLDGLLEEGSETESEDN